MSIKMMIIYTA